MKNTLILLLSILLISITSCSSKKTTTSTKKSQKTEKETTYIKKDILTKNEAEDLLVLREEEKLARDVYLYSYEKYNIKIFYNISLAEQQHMDKILFLLLKYGLKDPANMERGIFNNTKLQDLYNKLTVQSDISLIEALKVGATIEDLDIFDIDNFMSRTNDADITTAYKILNCGSRNHLRAFIKQLKKNDGTYTPQFLAQEKFNKIVKGTQEQCGKGVQKGKGKGMGKGHGQGRGRGRNNGF
jgi:hypothetical protein